MMAEERLFRLRCTYRKTGRLAYLSHLEITHALERIVRRSGLPFATTNGFSPHMKISFGTALPVGVGGECEIFDVYLRTYIPQDRALAMLEEASSEGLAVSDARYIDNGEPAASVAFPVSEYRAVYEFPIESIHAPHTLEVKKKKGMKSLAVSDFLVESPRIEGCDMRFKLVARESGSMRVDTFLNALQVVFESEDADACAPYPVRVSRIGMEEA